MIQHRRLLKALQGASCILSREAQREGPARVRTSLQERYGRAANDDDAARARQYLDAVDRIGDERARRVVALMAMTDDCAPAYSERRAESVLGIPQSTLRRLLRKGLEELAPHVEAIERAERMAA